MNNPSLRIGITLGDPAGIGPDVVQDALGSMEIAAGCGVDLIGSTVGHMPGKPTDASANEALKAMEEAGRVRRGYYVAGLGAAQFALRGADERLRSLRDEPEEEAAALVLSATDPANPYGAVLPWPEPCVPRATQLTLPKAKQIGEPSTISTSPPLVIIPTQSSPE